MLSPPMPRSPLTTVDSDAATERPSPWMKFIGAADRLIWQALRVIGGNDVDPRRTVRRSLLVLTVVMLAGIAICAQIPGLGFGWHFGEGRLMTLISVFALLVCGSICIKISAVRQSTAELLGSSSPHRTWRLLGYGFLFLAADELFRIHENLDRTLHKIVGVKPVGLTDHLDDAIVALYGLVMLVLLLKNLAEVRRFIEARWFFAGAFVCGCLTIGLDFFASAKWLWLLFSTDLTFVQFIIDLLDVIEEMFKIYAEVFFIGTLLACLHLSKRLTHTTQNPPIAD